MAGAEERRALRGRAAGLFRDRHGLDMGTQTMLVPRGLVFMDDALSGHAINNGDRRAEGALRFFPVTGRDGFLCLFQVGAERGTAARIMEAASF